MVIIVIAVVVTYASRVEVLTKQLMHAHVVCPLNCERIFCATFLFPVELDETVQLLCSSFSGSVTDIHHPLTACCCVTPAWFECMLL